MIQLRGVLRTALLFVACVALRINIIYFIKMNRDRSRALLLVLLMINDQNHRSRVSGERKKERVINRVTRTKERSYVNEMFTRNAFNRVV